jgi:hypothetical protein
VEIRLVHETQAALELERNHVPNRVTRVADLCQAYPDLFCRAPQIFFRETYRISITNRWKFALENHDEKQTQSTARYFFGFQYGNHYPYEPDPSLTRCSGLEHGMAAGYERLKQLLPALTGEPK